LVTPVQCQEAIANLDLMTSDDFIIYKVCWMHVCRVSPHHMQYSPFALCAMISLSSPCASLCSLPCRPVPL
jgi:hypothetical protein